MCEEMNSPNIIIPFTFQELFFFFFSLFKRQNESSIFSFSLQIHATARAGPDQSQEHKLCLVSHVSRRSLSTAAGVHSPLRTCVSRKLDGAAARARSSSSCECWASQGLWQSLACHFPSLRKPGIVSV